MNKYIEKFIKELSFKKIALVFLILISPAYFAPFHTDDFFHLLILSGSTLLKRSSEGSFFGLFSFVDQIPENREQLLRFGVLPWFSDPEFSMQFWRPLSELTHWLDYQIFGKSAFFPHLHSIFWFVLLCGIIHRLILRTFPEHRKLGLLALAIFTLDGQHVMTINWIANRSALIAACFAFYALLAHMKWREERKKQYFVFAVISFAAALCAGEIAISILAYLFFYTFFIDAKGINHGLMALLPYAIVSVMWLLIYNAFGYGIAAHDGLYISPLTNFSGFLVSVFTRIPIYIASGFLSIPAGLSWIGGSHYAEIGKVYLIFSVLFTFFILGMYLSKFKKNKIISFWFFSAIFSAVPICAALPQDRLAIFQTVGIDIFIACVIYFILFDKKAEITKNLSLIQNKLAIGLMFIHLILSPLYLFFGSIYINFAAREITKTALTFNNENSISHKDIVSFKSPIGMITTVIGIREFFGVDLPNSFVWLGNDEGEMTISVLNMHEILVERDVGFANGFESSFRSIKTSPIAKGEIFPIAVGQIEVMKVNQESYPNVIKLRLNKKINDPDLLFYNAQKGDIKSIKLPAIGESITL